MDVDNAEASCNVSVGKFAQFELVHYVEIDRYEDSQWDTFTHTRINSEESVFNAVLGSGKVRGIACIGGPDILPTARLRLIIFPRHRATRSEYLPLPLSGALFDTISSTFQLNESFLAILGSNMATVLQSPSIDNISRFVLQENMSYINFSMAITHDPIGKLTTGLVFGLSDSLMSGLSNDSISTFIEYLEASKALVTMPMLIPILAKEALALKSNLNAESCHDSVYQIEMSTRMRKKMGHLEGAVAEIPDWSQLDLLDTTRSLNSACTELAWGSLDAKSSIALLNFLEKVNRSYCPEFDPAIRNISSQDDLFVAVSILSAKNEYLQSWYRGIEERCQYLEKRAQAQVQTVYSLIAQKDNSLSIEIAEASRRISEASRHDNILMKALAEDSKSVALATARDSAAMRVIAVVTILFLPATFTATFFSTTFFDFKPQAQNRVVSGWLWLYFVITVLLTVAIQVTWYISSKRKEKEITQALTQGASAEALAVIAKKPSN